MSGYDPNQQRDWHGRWTDTGNEGGGPKAREGGGGDEGEDEERGGSQDRHDDEVIDIVDDTTAARIDPRDRVRLPPNEIENKYNDEVESLLEWIANARPDEEQAIRDEIKRTFEEPGDPHGATTLNNFLTRILKPGVTREERERLLLAVAKVYRNRDPYEIGEIRRRTEEAVGVLKPFLGAGRGPSGRKPPSGPPRSGAPERHRYWHETPTERGRLSEALYGPVLHPNFPVIDLFPDDIATSIKSLDLTTMSYQTGTYLSNRINGFVNKLVAFRGRSFADIDIQEDQIRGRELKLIIPKGAATSAQRQAIDVARDRAATLGVTLKVHEL